MQTQRDHVHAHQFMMGRLSSALVQGDASTAEVPGRRAWTGVLIGVLVIVLVAAGFAVYGFIVPGGSKAYRQAGAILVEKETGVRYVYLNGVLHPTPNLASAMLIQGSRSTVKLISRKSLAGIPRGSLIGIDGAPQIVPDASAVVGGPWLTCLPASGDVPGLNLDPGAAVKPVGRNGYTVVRAGERTFVLYADHKFEVSGTGVLIALGAADVEPVKALPLWLSWIPSGPDLAAAEIERDGSAGPRVGGSARRVGTLFRQSGTEQLYVLHADGLAPISPTEFKLLQATEGRAVVEADTADVANAPQSDDRTLTGRLPDLAELTPRRPAGDVLCLRQQPASAETFSSVVVFAAPDQAGLGPDGRGTVRAKPGSAMLAIGVPLPERGQKPAPEFISEEGRAYSMPDTMALSSLRLNSAPIVPFPKHLLTALPHGPALTRDAVTGLDGR